MTKLIPNPKEPKESTDYIYGERMEPYEERMNFFLNEKIDVKKDDVKEEDKETVDGLESVIQRFTEYRSIPLAVLDESPTDEQVDGLESVSRLQKVIDVLVQFAKDAVDWLLNLINNRISRLDNREFRVSLERKRAGIVSTEVNYPVGIRRLLAPLKVSTDPNWVAAVLKDVNDFYNQSINAYKDLTKDIGSTTAGRFSLDTAIKESIQGAARNLKMKLVSGQGTYLTEILPGNRQLAIDDITNGDTGQIKIYFQTSSVDTKLKEKTFVPSSFMVDNTLAAIKSLIKTIRSNQSTVSQLYRTFEKTVKQFQHNNGTPLSREQQEYLNWLIRFNKRLMSTTIQYVLDSLDTGLDFVNAGIQK